MILALFRSTLSAFSGRKNLMKSSMDFPRFCAFLNSGEKLWLRLCRFVVEVEKILAKFKRLYFEISRSFFIESWSFERPWSELSSDLKIIEKYHRNKNLHAIFSWNVLKRSPCRWWRKRRAVRVCGWWRGGVYDRGVCVKNTNYLGIQINYVQILQFTWECQIIRLQIIREYKLFANTN